MFPEDDIMCYSDSMRKQEKKIIRYKTMSAVFGITTLGLGFLVGYISNQCNYLNILWDSL